MVDLTPSMDGLGKDNCKTRRKTFKFKFGATYTRDLMVGKWDCALLSYCTVSWIVNYLKENKSNDTVLHRVFIWTRFFRLPYPLPQTGVCYMQKFPDKKHRKYLSKWWWYRPTQEKAIINCSLLSGLLSKHKETRTKRWPVWKRHFQCHFLQWKYSLCFVLT